MRWDLVEERLRVALSVERFRSQAGRVLSGPEGTAAELRPILLEAMGDGDPESQRLQDKMEEEDSPVGELEVLEERWPVETLCEFVWDSIGPMSSSAFFGFLRVADDFTCMVFYRDEGEPVWAVAAFEPRPEPELVGWAFRAVLVDNGEGYGISVGGSLPDLTLNHRPDLLSAEAVFAGYRAWVSSTDWEELVRLRDSVVELLTEPSVQRRALRLLRRLPAGGPEELWRWLEGQRRSRRAELDDIPEEHLDLVVRAYLALTYKETPAVGDGAG